MNDHGRLGLYAIGCVVLTSVVKVAFSIRFFANIFLGREPRAVGEHFHAPPPAILAPPLLLAASALLLGVWPGLLDTAIHLLAVAGLHNPPAHLAVWHGFTRELFVSMTVVLLGFGLFLLGQRTAWRWAAIPRALRFDDFFEGAVNWLSVFARKLTRALRADRPVDYLLIIIAFMVCVVGGMVTTSLWPKAGEWTEWAGNLPALHPLRTFVCALISLAVVAVVLTRRWTTQLISLSVAGFLTTFFFVLYRAPDLALTQILIEVATLILILILLGRFPKSAEVGEQTFKATPVRKAMNICVALGVGGLMTVFVLWVSANPHKNRIGHHFAENTVELAEGSNAVNTILVDFRGFDTFGEITVLVIAMLGGLGLLMRYKRTPEEYRQGPMGPPGLGIQHGGREDK